MNALFVSSTANPKFKFLQSLRNSKARKSEQCAAVEGVKEIEIANNSGVKFLSLFYVKNIGEMAFVEQLSLKHPSMDLIELDEQLFSKVSYRESTGGIIAIVETVNVSPFELEIGENALVLVIEGVEKPGNLGAILRTADAVKVDAVLACNLPGDLYNPNVIRASLGTIFSVPIAVSDNATAMKWLKKNNVKTYCSNLHNAKNYFDFDYKGSTAIVVGTEADGISNEWIEFADENVKIPMHGLIDSMNVSVATAIMLYEVKRQRLI